MKKIVFSLLFIIIIIMVTPSFAGVIMPDNTAAVYNNWNKNNVDNTENIVQPSMYSLKIDDSVKKSTFNGFINGVGVPVVPSSYNLFNDIDIEIKNQKNTNECWAFSTTTMLESNISKTRNKNIILSPRHMDYATSRTFLNGTNTKGFNREIGFGNFYIGLAYCTKGQGPVLEQDMPFVDNEELINLSEIDIKPTLKVENYLSYANIYKTISNGNITYTDGDSTIYTEDEVNGIRNLIKNHIKTYGAVSGYMYLNEDLGDYIGTDGGVVAYYNNDNTKQFNHGVTLVGWNDEFPKEYFNSEKQPIHDGAYLVLNSSTADIEELSLIAISYDDVWIESQCFGIISTTDVDYDNIYQHDEYGYDMPLTLTDELGGIANSGYIANVFNREIKQDKDEYLNEVSLYIAKTSNVDIYINENGDNKNQIQKAASAGILEPGYHTIKLSTPKKLTSDKFVIAAKLASDGIMFATETNLNTNGGMSTYWDFATSKAGESFISLDGQDWSDLNESIADSNICIKAFTTYQEKQTIKVNSISLNKNKAEIQEGESFTLVATINPSDAENKEVKWTSSDLAIAKVSNNGIVTGLKEGTATITVTTVDGNKTATCTVTVKGKIKEDDKVYYPKDGDTNNPNKVEVKNDNDPQTIITTNSNDTAGLNSDESDNENPTVITVHDTTIANKILPKTGTGKVVFLFIIISLVSGIIYLYNKLNELKDIK